MFVIYLRGERSELCLAPDKEENVSYSHDNYLSSIFLKKSPLVPVAYFGGPWLPMSFVQELVNYTFSLKYPLQILEIPERRRNLVNSLLELKSPELQSSLFNNNERSYLESLLDGLLMLKNQGRPIYKRWSKVMNGKKRDFAVPQKALDELLRKYVHNIIIQAPCHAQCHGGEKGWSPAKSLEVHLPIGTAFSFDMVDAFKNTTLQYAFDLYYRTFENKLPNQEVRRDVAGFLTTLSTVYYKDTKECALPLGSSIGMALFNRILYPVDKILHKRALKRNLTYTRWIDDFIISAREKNRSPRALFGALAILRKDFPIHLGKIFLQQNAPAYYLLGHKIIDDAIIKVDKEEANDKGKPISSQCFATEMELQNALMLDDWITDELNLFY